VSTLVEEIADEAQASGVSLSTIISTELRPALNRKHP